VVPTTEVLTGRTTKTVPTTGTKVRLVLHPRPRSLHHPNPRKAPLPAKELPMVVVNNEEVPTQDDEHFEKKVYAFFLTHRLGVS